MFKVILPALSRVYFFIKAKRKSIFFLLMVYPVALYFLLNDYKNYPRPARSFYQFDTTELSGRLDYVAVGHRSQYFILNKDTNAYQVRMYDVNATNARDFDDIAYPGDSIVKHRNATVLMLFKPGGIRYFYIDRKIQYKEVSKHDTIFGIPVTW